MSLGQPMKPQARRRIGSTREGEASDSGEVWTLLRALGLLALGVVVMSWILT
ncbi:hypothetical protein ACI6QG_01930 [Roseococcus sp. DSY-14]|uniref:hypothetical protein n=1 Tax=Roseococcus sp. DSY-14 TaxID=3369650 RepID=UPI00387AB60C